jgi:hypothetical protein
MSIFLLQEWGWGVGSGGRGGWRKMVMKKNKKRKK